MDNLSHAQARRYIENSSAGSLSAEEWQALNAHLAGCETCQTYMAQFKQREAFISQTLQSSHPRPRFTAQELQKKAAEIKQQTKTKNFFAAFFHTFQTFAWSSIAIALVIGFVWILNNAVPQPILTAASPSPAAATLLPEPTLPPTPNVGAMPDTPPPDIQPAENENLVREIQAHIYRVNQVTFSPDGNLLATASADGTVRVWRAWDGTLLHTLRHAREVTSAAFSQNGDLLASGGKDGLVNIWAASDGAHILTLGSALDSPVKHVSFSPAGDLLAVGRQDYKGEVWQVTAGQKLELFSSYNRLENAVGGDGKGYVLATSESVVWLHDTDGEAFGLNLQGQTGKILDLAISTDGRLLAAGSTDKKLYLWRVFDVTVQEENGIANTSTRTLLGPLLLTLDQHDGWVTSVAFCPEDDTMASASEDGTVKVWRVSDGALLRTLEGHTGGVHSVTFSPDGSLIASASEDGTVRLWKAP